MLKHFLLVSASFSQTVVIFLIELLKAPFVKSVSYLLHKLIVEEEVMKYCETHSKGFLSLKKMAYVGS